jgi:hypothetical protein
MDAVVGARRLRRFTGARLRANRLITSA